MTHKLLRIQSLIFLLSLISLGWLFTWSSSDWNTSIPVDSTDTATVPLFNLWTIWWNWDRALHGWQDYWDAPIFHPASGTFAFSEPQPFTLIVGPVIGLTGSKILAYRFYLCLNLLLNGGVTAYSLWRRRYCWWICVLGGASMLLLPLNFSHIETVQLIPVWSIIWTWSALSRLGRAPSWRRGLEVGLAWGLTGLICLHHALFMSLLLCLTGWVCLRLRPFRKSLPSWTIAGLTTAMLLLPVVIPVSREAAKHQLVRPIEAVEQLSATPTAFVTLPSSNAFSALAFTRSSPRGLSPGMVKYLLLLLVVGRCALRKRIPRDVLFLSLTAGLAAMLACGTNLKFGNWGLWTSLTAIVPGFSQVRSAYRFAYFFQIAMILLSATGLQQLVVMNRHWNRVIVRRRCGSLLIVLLGMASCLEAWPVRPLSLGIPDEVKQRGWIDFVEQQTPQGKAIVCLPFATGGKVADFDGTTRWMYYGTFHKRPLVNGYSGFFPEDYWTLHAAINDSFPSDRSLKLLEERDVHFVIVLQAEFPSEQILSESFSGHRLEQVYSDSCGVDVYRLMTLE